MGKTNENAVGPYFLVGRLEFAAFACFAFFEVGGGGVAIMHLTASSKLIPGNRKSMAFGMK